ncbi:MAG: hypothetical protein J6T51_02700 [Kiritimatiellae bacterium]|nr:hypothetical protein [Kiritimatiellia bacterium]
MNMNEANGVDAVLELYRTTVRNMLASDKPGLVPNASYRHASIIIEELIRSARRSFFAYCGKMSCDVWTVEVMEQLRLAISRGVDVHIVMTDAVEVPPFLNGRVHTLNLDKQGAYREAYESIQHFAVVDGKSLRMEKDPATREAVFAANRPDFAVELERIFYSLRAAAAA